MRRDSVPSQLAGNLPCGQTRAINSGMSTILDFAVPFFFIYFVLWWLVLFAVLPIGVQRDEAPEAGHDHGAPRSANIRQKMIWTTWINFALTSAIVFGLWLIGFVG